MQVIGLPAAQSIVTPALPAGQIASIVQETAIKEIYAQTIPPSKAILSGMSEETYYTKCAPMIASEMIFPPGKGLPGLNECSLREQMTLSEVATELAYLKTANLASVRLEESLHDARTNGDKRALRALQLIRPGFKILCYDKKKKRETVNSFFSEKTKKLSPIQRAVSNGWLETVVDLKEAGASLVRPKEETSFYTSEKVETDPLLFLALKNNKENQEAMINGLIELGCDLHEVDDADNTLLHLAFACKKVAFAALLLERGVSASCCNRSGDNALHSFIRCNDKENPDSVEMARKLIAGGASVTQANCRGETPLLLYECSTGF